MSKPLKIGIVAGEESGTLLGADLVDALNRHIGKNVSLVGVGGSALEERGLKSLFDPEEIALIGLGAVLKKIPQLMLRIRQTARLMMQERPDCVILIDSPDFTHRVAKKLRDLDPTIPIIKYIAPSVWAWRPERAAAMKAYIDHVLVILPFEERVMKELGGPDATYVGHRLVTDMKILKVRAERKARLANEAPVLVVLPGSRRSEIRSLMPVFGEAVDTLSQRVLGLKVVLPTLPKIEQEVRSLAEQWAVKPDVVVGEEEKWQSFIAADIALAASGTVSLELALSAIPTVLSYKADWISKLFILPKIKMWSAALPNIIADEPVVPEFFNEFIRPGMLARQLQSLTVDSAARQAQFDGFARIWQNMQTEKPSGDIAAEAILTLLKQPHYIKK